MHVTILGKAVIDVVVGLLALATCVALYMRTHRTLRRRLLSSDCLCGYPLDVVKMPMCPECGRVASPLPLQRRTNSFMILETLIACVSTFVILHVGVAQSLGLCLWATTADSNMFKAVSSRLTLPWQWSVAGHVSANLLAWITTAVIIMYHRRGVNGGRK